LPSLPSSGWLLSLLFLLLVWLAQNFDFVYAGPSISCPVNNNRSFDLPSWKRQKLLTQLIYKVLVMTIQNVIVNLLWVLRCAWVVCWGRIQKIHGTVWMSLEHQVDNMWRNWEHSLRTVLGVVAWNCARIIWKDRLRTSWRSVRNIMFEAMC